jgi:hypothetical protein
MKQFTSDFLEPPANAVDGAAGGLRPCGDLSKDDLPPITCIGRRSYDVGDLNRIYHIRSDAHLTAVLLSKGLWSLGLFPRSKMRAYASHE